MSDTNIKSKKSVIGTVLKFVVPVIVSVGLCWVLFRNDNIGPMIDVVREQCDFKWIGLMLLASFCSFLFRAMRWRLQLQASEVKVSFKDIVYSIFGTYAINIVFPRLGELWRTGYIANRARSDFGTVFGSMLADRFADLITVMLITLLTALVGHEAIASFIKAYPQGYERIVALVSSPWVWTVIVAVVAVLWVFFARRHTAGIALRIQQFARQLWDGFAAILHVKQKGAWLFWTVMLWGCYFLQMVLAFEAFPFTREIVSGSGLVPVLVCFTLGSIAMGIPSNGGIGPYQLALIFGLSLYMPQGADDIATKAFELDSKAFANLVLTMSTCLTIAVGLWTFVAIACRKKPRREE